MVHTGGDAIGRLREQWDDGNNTLALAPGVVVGYERNQETNRRLRDAGIEVLELDASELCRDGRQPVHDPAAAARPSMIHPVPDGAGGRGRGHVPWPGDRRGCRPSAPSSTATRPTSPAARLASAGIPALVDRR